VPASDYTPDVDAVAAYIRARTKTQGGAEAGTFNPAAWWDDNSGRGTRPTAEQVETLITLATGKVSNIIGADVLPEHQDAARDVVALRAAMLTELDYWPEQVNTGRSTYPQLKELWDEAWADLLSSMGIDTDDGGGAVAAGAGFPSYGGFPETAIGMEHPW
jgi:hypothetical protein